MRDPAERNLADPSESALYLLGGVEAGRHALRTVSKAKPNSRTPYLTASYDGAKDTGIGSVVSAGPGRAGCLLATGTITEMVTLFKLIYRKSRGETYRQMVEKVDKSKRWPPRSTFRFLFGAWSYLVCPSLFGASGRVARAILSFLARANEFLDPAQKVYERRSGISIAKLSPSPGVQQRSARAGRADGKDYAGLRELRKEEAHPRTEKHHLQAPCQSLVLAFFKPAREQKIIAFCCVAGAGEQGSDWGSAIQIRAVVARPFSQPVARLCIPLAAAAKLKVPTSHKGETISTLEVRSSRGRRLDRS